MTVTVYDGVGWPEYPKHHYCCTRVFAMNGTEFQEIESYPDIALWDLLIGVAVPCYGMSAFAIEGSIYQYLSTSDHHFEFADKRTWRGSQFNGAKLIYSSDGGYIWRNQDGSTRVPRGSRQDLSAKELVFLKERRNAYSLLSFLQVGKAFQDNGVQNKAEYQRLRYRWRQDHPYFALNAQRVDLVLEYVDEDKYSLLGQFTRRCSYELIR
jgi:hypothetical protein